MTESHKKHLNHPLVVSDYYLLYIERGQSQFFLMSAIVTNCVTDPLRSVRKVCEKREGIFTSLFHMCITTKDRAGILKYDPIPEVIERV